MGAPAPMLTHAHSLVATSFRFTYKVLTSFYTAEHVRRAVLQGWGGPFNNESPFKNICEFLLNLTGLRCSIESVLMFD
jgi:hypothetical protein